MFSHTFLFQAIQNQCVLLLWKMKHQFKNGCFKNRYIIVVQIELGNEFLLFKRETFIIKPVFIYFCSILRIGESAL